MNDGHTGAGVVILAAGKGTRMKSDLPKVLHTLAGRPLLAHVIDTAKAIGANRIVVIAGHGRDELMGRFAGADVSFAVQDPQLGTGHAVEQAEPFFTGFDGPIAILSGDVPLLRPETVLNLLRAHRKTGAAVTVLTCDMDEPGSYGRIIRRGDRVVANVEAKDATAGQLAVKEINSGVYVFDAAFLFPALKKIDNRNAQGEFYLTDLIGLAAQEGRTVTGVKAAGPVEIQGVNTVKELATLERAYTTRHRP